MAYVKRDPFARAEIHSSRETVTGARSCQNCGQVKTRKSGSKYLLSFRSESDGGRSSEIRGLFCTYTCCKQYHS